MSTDYGAAEAAYPAEPAIVIQSPDAGLRIDTDRLMASVARHGRKDSQRQPFAAAVRGDQGPAARPANVGGHVTGPKAQTRAPDRTGASSDSPARAQQASPFPRLDPETQPDSAAVAEASPRGGFRPRSGRHSLSTLVVVIAAFAATLAMLVFFLGPLSFG